LVQRANSQLGHPRCGGLSTDTVPSHEAFAHCRDVLAQHFVHLRPERAELGPFRSIIEAQQLEGYSFSRVHARQRVHRTMREISRSPDVLVFLNLHFAWPRPFLSGGRRTRSEPRRPFYPRYGATVRAWLRGRSHSDITECSTTDTRGTNAPSGVRARCPHSRYKPHRQTSQRLHQDPVATGRGRTEGREADTSRTGE
jgi:hypothetical protein